MLAGIGAKRIELSAIVTRADGSVENLGIICSKEFTLWQQLLQKLVAVLPRIG